MIYLVRTAQSLKFDEDLFEKTNNLIEHIGESYPLIKDMKVLYNITGPVNEVHWVLEFESLADEDEWGTMIMQDEHYIGWLRESHGIISPFVDRLYREARVLPPAT